MITDKQFLIEENEDEVLSVIESFLNRWREQIKKTYPNEPITDTFYKFAPTDKEKAEIVKEMIKDFKAYKN